MPISRQHRPAKPNRLPTLVGARLLTPSIRMGMARARANPRPPIHSSATRSPRGRRRGILLLTGNRPAVRGWLHHDIRVREKMQVRVRVSPVLRLAQRPPGNRRAGLPIRRRLGPQWKPAACPIHTATSSAATSIPPEACRPINPSSSPLCSSEWSSCGCGISHGDRRLSYLCLSVFIRG